MIENASISFTLHLLWLPLNLPLSTASGWWSCSSTGRVIVGIFGEEAHDFLWVRMAELDRFADSSPDVFESLVESLLPYIRCELESCKLLSFGSLHRHLSWVQQFLQWECLFRKLWYRIPMQLAASKHFWSSAVFDGAGRSRSPQM